MFTPQYDKAQNGGSGRFASTEAKDFYPTPDECTLALLEREHFAGMLIEDPACGNGAICKILERKGFATRGFDIESRGYGVIGNFFERNLNEDRPDAIITNPPYFCANQFVHCSLKFARKKVAMLLRLAFLEGIERGKTIFKSNPPTRVWVFSKRVTMYPGGVQTGGGGTIAFAWFVWDLERPRTETALGWIVPS